MADEQNSEGTGEAGATGATGNTGSEDKGKQHDEHLRKAYAERDDAKKELRGLKAKIAEYEGRDRKAAEERERAAGDWKSLEERYRTDLRGKDERIAELEGRLQGLEKGDRQRRFVDAIVSEGKIINRELVEAMLGRIGLENDAPDAFTDGDVKKALRGLQAKAPELFTTTSNNRPPPKGGTRFDPNNPEHWREVGRRATSGGVPEPYAAATGRKQG